MLRLRLSNPKSAKEFHQTSTADKYAVRYGFLTALIIAIYNFIIQLNNDGGLESAHLVIFLILFLMIGFGMDKGRKWIRERHATDDRMLFGMVMAITTSIGLIILNGLIAIFDYHDIVSEMILPIDDRYKFAVNSMTLFFGCLIVGFASSAAWSVIYSGKR